MLITCWVFKVKPLSSQQSSVSFTEERWERHKTLQTDEKKQQQQHICFLVVISSWRCEERAASASWCVHKHLTGGPFGWMSRICCCGLETQHYANRRQPIFVSSGAVSPRCCCIRDFCTFLLDVARSVRHHAALWLWQRFTSKTFLGIESSTRWGLQSFHYM